MDRKERFGQVITEIVNAVELQRGELRDPWAALEIQGSAMLWYINDGGCYECGCPLSGPPHVRGDNARYAPEYDAQVWEFTLLHGNHLWRREEDLYFTEGEAKAALSTRLREHRQALDEQIAALEKGREG